MKLQTSQVQIDNFQKMDLAPSLLSALTKMAVTKPTPVQSEAIPVALDGHDLIAIAQTGSGKTLAFALSLLTTLYKKPSIRALVLAPSREMAQQIFKVINELCLADPMTTCLVIGGIPGAKQSSQLKKNPRVIVGTPGRLNDHLITNKLLLQNVEVIVIDEADRMLDMGFAPQLKSIQKTLRTKVQTLMFSASFDSSIETMAQNFMSSSPYMIRAESAELPVSTLTQKVLFIDRGQKKDRLLDELNVTKTGVIVFCSSQNYCEEIGEYLMDYGYATDMIHGGLSQGHRNRVIRQFREGKIRIVVATDLLARGLDVPHVDHVINFDLPFAPEDFLHRIGRTARAGRSGSAVTFVTSSSADHDMYQKIKQYLGDAEEIKLDKYFKFREAKAEYKKSEYKEKPRSDKYKSLKKR